MRIGIDTRPLSYELTGIGVYLKHLLDEIQRIDFQNQYYLISNTTIHYELINSRWRKVEGRFKKRQLSTLWMQCVAPIIARKLKLHVFWGPRHHLPMLLPRNIRTVLTIHDLVYRLYPETMPLPNLIAEHLLMKPSTKRARFIITDTYSMAADIASELRVPPEKVAPIYPGRPKLPERSDVESGLDHNLPARFFLFVGTLDPRKNFRRILAAFRLMNPVKYDVHLIIVGGEGWKSQVWMKMLHYPEIRFRVHFSGYISLDVLPIYYKKAVCLIYPSLYEGFGLPILESMSCGTPVITSNVSSMKEVCKNAALLINPLDVQELASAMKRVLTDESLKVRLSVKGVQRANEFSWKRCAEQTLKIILDSDL